MKDTSVTVARRAAGVMLGERSRFWLSASPVVFVFLLTEWLLLTSGASFTGFLSWQGVIAVSLFAGLLPILMLVSSRRKGEFAPGMVFRFLGHPLLVTTLYLLFLANIFLHGLIIWQGRAERASAVCMGLLLFGATVLMIGRGAFARRMVIALRKDRREDIVVFAITIGG
jgi:hypothetical protein